MRSSLLPRIRRTPVALLTLLALVTFTGCGSGGGIGTPEDAGPPAAIVFPPGPSITMAETLTVRGIVPDPTAVVEITVNDVVATTTDGFATWAAEVGLAEGVNSIDVRVDRGIGPVSEAGVSVRREGPVSLIFLDGALDATAGALYLGDRYGVVIAIDLATGVRRRVLGQHVGPYGSGTLRIAVDESTGLVYMSDGVSGDGRFRLTAVDPVTGIATVISESGDGKGPDITSFSLSLYPIAVDPVAGRALIVHRSPGLGLENRVLEVDLGTGVRTTLYEQVRDAGTEEFHDIAIAPGSGSALLADRNGIYSVTLATGALTTLASTGAGLTAVDHAGQRAYVQLGLGDGIHAVDLTTGAITLVAPEAGQPPELSGVRSRGLWFHPGDGLLKGLADDVTSLIEIDPSTGSRTLLQDLASTGPATRPNALVVVDEGQLAYCNSDENLVALVDLPTGGRGTLSANGIGTGPEVDSPQGIAVAEARDAVYAVNADIFPNPIHRIDLATGARELVTGDTLGSGIDMCYSIDMDRAADGTLYVVDEDDSQVVAVDPMTGDRRRVAGDGVGTGPEISNEDGCDYDDATDTLYLCQGDGILAIDPVTGDRTVFLDGSAFTPAQVLDPRDVVVSEDGSELYFIDADDKLYHVHVATRVPTVILDPATTPGFPLTDPFRLAGAPAAGVLFVSDWTYDAIFAIDVRTGESVLVAR